MSWSKSGVPTPLLAGRVADRGRLVEAGFSDAVCISDDAPATATPLDPNTARRNIVRSVTRKLKQ